MFLFNFLLNFRVHICKKSGQRDFGYLFGIECKDCIDKLKKSLCKIKSNN